MHSKTIYWDISVFVGETIDKKSNNQDNNFFPVYFYYTEKEDLQVSLAKHRTQLRIFPYPMIG